MNRLLSPIVALIAVVAVRPGVAFADKPARFGISAVRAPLEDYFSEGPKVVVPFIVYGTGCDEVAITATLKGVPKAKLGTAKVKTTIPFNCGE